MRNMVSALLMLIPLFSIAQKNFNNYFQFYPIGDDPNIGYRTSIIPSEKLIFEANPNVRYSFYNNIQKGLLNEKTQNHVSAWYVAFRPQIRMYDRASLPVVMPSYRVFLGTQHMFRLKNDNFLSFSLESGHYSNGQSGSAFSETLVDGTKESEALYNDITPETNLSAILNRKSGNFSTNLTELLFNYRNNHYSDNIPVRVHSITGGLVFYHNRFLGIGKFGGYSANDIKLYGRYRWQLGYEFTKQLTNFRYSIAEKMELIGGAHPSVEPFRSETIASVYPFKSMQALGFFVNYTFGHDNYNYRFVDSASNLFFGVTWSGFPPFAMKGDF